MGESIIEEIIIEGSSESGKNIRYWWDSFSEKSEGLYEHVDRYGGKTEEFILINETGIKNDDAWMKENNIHRKDKIDLELARSYQKVLEQRYYEMLVEMQTLDTKISYVSFAWRQENYPQYNPVEGESQEAVYEKSSYCCVYHNMYKDLVLTDIAAELKIDIEDVKNYLNSLSKNLLGKKLYVLNKKENCGKKFREAFSNAVETTVKKHWKALKTEEESYMKANEEHIKKDKELIQQIAEKDAKKEAYKQIFLYRKWNVETWIELIFLKFYKELDEKRIAEFEKIDKEFEKRKLPEYEMENQRICEQTYNKLKEENPKEFQKICDKLKNKKPATLKKMFKELDEKKLSALEQLYKELKTQNPSKYEKTYNELKERNKTEYDKKKEWIASETKEWFCVEKENVWRFTEKAVMKLTELEDEEKKLDLMNYRFTPNVSLYGEINKILVETDRTKDYLEYKTGIERTGVIRRLNRKLKGMEPFTACVLWQETNAPFKDFIQITPVEITIKDKEVMQAYRNNVKLKIGEKGFMLERYKKYFKDFEEEKYGEKKGNKKNLKENEAAKMNPEEIGLWCVPMFGWDPQGICIELYSTEKIRVKVRYATFMMDEPFVFELPYSGAMKKMLTLDDETVLNIAEDAEYITKEQRLEYSEDEMEKMAKKSKEQLLRYGAEMMARKYCKIFLGITYTEFQKMKCHADIKFEIQPVILNNPDGTVQLEYMGIFHMNQMKWGYSRTYYNRIEGQVWKNREELEKDWETLKEKMYLGMIEEFKKWNEEKKEYSEYSISLLDFFDCTFVKAKVTDESIRVWEESEKNLKESIRKIVNEYVKETERNSKKRKGIVEDKE